MLKQMSPTVHLQALSAAAWMARHITLTSYVVDDDGGDDADDDVGDGGVRCAAADIDGDDWVLEYHT